MAAAAAISVAASRAKFKCLSTDPVDCEDPRSHSSGDNPELRAVRKTDR